MRRYRPFPDYLESRLALSGSPWLPGPPVQPPPGHSGAQVLLQNGFAIVIGSNFGDTMAAHAVDTATVEVDVTNPNGSDAFLIPASDVLEVNAGTGTNSFTSTANDTLIYVGGVGDNTAAGGTGFNFLVSTGSGNNVFTGGSYYNVFEGASTGSTAMNATGQFSSASMMLGVNTYNAGSQVNVIYAYGGANTVNGVGTNQVDVYYVTPTPPTVNANGDPNIRLHQGLF